MPFKLLVMFYLSPFERLFRKVIPTNMVEFSLTDTKVYKRKVNAYLPANGIIFCKAKKVKGHHVAPCACKTCF